jgi:hypothetical protein
MKEGVWNAVRGMFAGHGGQKALWRKYSRYAFVNFYGVFYRIETIYLHRLFLFLYKVLSVTLYTPSRKEFTREITVNPRYKTVLGDCGP